MDTDHPNCKRTQIAFGGISGYVNTDVELKSSPSSIRYVSILLGRSKDEHGNNLISYAITFFAKDAELFASQVTKGDLIRVTCVALNPVRCEGMTYATRFTLIGKGFELIGQRMNPAPTGTGTSPRTTGDPDPEASRKRLRASQKHHNTSI